MRRNNQNRQETPTPAVVHAIVAAAEVAARSTAAQFLLQLLKLLL